MTSPGIACPRCSYRAALASAECPRCHTPYPGGLPLPGSQPTMIHSPMSPYTVAPPAVPAAAPQLLDPAHVPPMPPQQGGSRGWHMVHALQSTLLLVLLAFAILLLYRHQTMLAKFADQEPYRVEPPAEPVSSPRTSGPPDPNASRLIFTPEIRLTRVGRTISLAGSLRTATSLEVPLNELVWTSGNPSVAVVDAYGNVTGVSVGGTGVTVRNVRTGSVAAIAVNVNALEPPRSNGDYSFGTMYPAQPQTGASTSPGPAAPYPTVNTAGAPMPGYGYNGTPDRYSGQDSVRR